jgi:hypothetical protein
MSKFNHKFSDYNHYGGCLDGCQCDCIVCCERQAEWERRAEAGRRDRREKVKRIDRGDEKPRTLPHTRADIDHPTPEARTKFNQERNERIVGKLWPNKEYPITLECPRCFFEFGHMKGDKFTECFYCEEISAEEAPGKKPQNHTALNIVTVWNGLKVMFDHPVGLILVVLVLNTAIAILVGLSAPPAP